jgi:hypothetical protein
MAVRAFLAGLMLFLMLPAWAHDHDRPELNGWMRGLHSKRTFCCDGTDATAMDKLDWRISSPTDTKKCRVTSVDHLSGDSHYCVWIGHDWWRVPDDVVIDEPNLDGRTLVWGYATIGKNGEIEDYFFRCFMPGPGA